MAYSINKYSGGTPTLVEDGTIDNTFDLKLIGKNYSGYGTIQNENFVHLLENFSGSTAPPRPISGQIWFDTGVKKVKFYDGTKWRSTGGAEVSATAPTGLSIGDFWFDSDNKQLYAWDGATWILIGPEGAPGLGITAFKSKTLLDIYAAPHAVIEGIINGSVIFIYSSDEFTIDSGVNPVIGFSVIKKGCNLVNTGTNGVTSSDHTFWGTSSYSLKTQSVEVGGFYRQATVTSSANTVAVRDANADIFANVFQGVAASAKYADLAEKYLADADYSVGTVMVVGGDKEVTAGSYGDRAIGVISQNPAFMMNNELEGGVYVALKGRVPVKIVGSVKKGQRLVAGNNGTAVAAVPHANDVFAIALESSDDTGEKLIEAIIL